jgi:hypothetical protein
MDKKATYQSSKPLGGKVNFNSKEKLLHGLIRLLFSSYFLFNYTEKDLKSLQKWMIAHGSEYMPKDLAEFLTICALLVFVWKLIKFFVVGLLQVLTYRERIALMHERPWYANWNRTKTGGSFNNIEEAIRYRESVMAGMNSADAAAYLNSTSRLDTFRDGGKSYGPNTQRAASFADSRMAGLNNADKISYIQGKIK